VAVLGGADAGRPETQALGRHRLQHRLLELGPEDPVRLPSQPLISISVRRSPRGLRISARRTPVARAATRSRSPSERRAATAFAETTSPNPASSSLGARSITIDSTPARSSPIAAARPPIPAPTTTARMPSTLRRTTQNEALRQLGRGRIGSS
jgi:hypothetical protein